MQKIIMYFLLIPFIIYPISVEQSNFNHAHTSSPIQLLPVISTVSGVCTCVLLMVLIVKKRTAVKHSISNFWNNGIPYIKKQQASIYWGVIGLIWGTRAYIIAKQLRSCRIPYCSGSICSFLICSSIAGLGIYKAIKTY